jgi:DNA polymerase-4
MSLTKRRILHIDMDAFFAAVEERRDPSLAGRPVVVGGMGDPTRRGVVSTANYEARKYGIHSAMPLRTAYTLCPHAIFLPVDYEQYAAVSHEVKSVLRGITPLMEDVGIDEAFLDISEVPQTEMRIVERIKVGIKERTGLTCSIGLAPNKLLAKIASDMQKPDGLTMLSTADVEDRLWPLPVRKLYGVGPKTESALRAMGIETIGQVAALPLADLLDRFGRSYGHYLYFASRGIDDSPLITHWEPKSISRERTFQTDISNWQAIARSLAELTREMAEDMKSRGYKAGTFTIKIRFGDFETVSRSLTLGGVTRSEDEMRKAVFACLKRIELKKRVRLIGVRASHLERAD